jgi:uncharacterized damage-inducible protein DinB
MNTEEIRQVLENTFAGTPWYGKALQKTLRDLPPGKSTQRINGSYNMAELVHHMLAWRNYVIQLLETRKHHEVTEMENFPVIEVISADEWNDLLNRFDESQDKLKKLLSAPVELEAPVPQKPYSYREVLLGLVHHDIYHAGQLNLLAKYL